MNKEIKKSLENFKKKDILSQTVLLNWLRQWTDLYEKGKEGRFHELLKGLVTDILEEELDEFQRREQ